MTKKRAARKSTAESHTGPDPDANPSSPSSATRARSDLSSSALPATPAPLSEIQKILAGSPPKKPRARKRETSKSLGVYDADRDILDQYLYEVSQTPLLNTQQEIAIAKLVRQGDQEAMHELVKRNLRFVISVAKKYQNRGLPLTDLIGEGNVGLLTAARQFDPEQGVKFLSYAVRWIRPPLLAASARPRRPGARRGSGGSAAGGGGGSARAYWAAVRGMAGGSERVPAAATWG